MKNNFDVITQKQTMLKKLQKKSNSALNLVTSTINSLSVVNEQIDQTIYEIAEAKMQLDNTESELQETKNKNSIIITKFKNLIGEQICLDFGCL